MSNPILCIYHGNCADGFGAAWAVRERFVGDVEFHHGVYQADPPDVRGKWVVIVDFSYKRPVLEAMAASARSILVLDHHKSAAEDLAGLPVPVHTDWLPSRGLYALFDMHRSGARIAWDYFHPGATPPPLLQHIEDRDLWRFALEGTREIQAALFSYPYDFDLWARLMRSPVDDLRRQGEAIERKHHKDVAELLAVTQRRMTIGGHDVPVASLPYTMVSDAAHLMARGEPFAACYWDTSEARIFGLRSTTDGIDVSQIASLYGGGGHEHAAGFKVTRDHDLARA